MVVDGGTPQEKTSVFSAAEAVRTDITLDQLVPGAPSLPMASVLPRMGPLSVGEHTFELVLVLTAQHRDGLGVVVEDNCIPAGETPLGVRPIVITTPET